MPVSERPPVVRRTKNENSLTTRLMPVSERPPVVQCTKNGVPPVVILAWKNLLISALLSDSLENQYSVAVGVAMDYSCSQCYTVIDQVLPCLMKLFEELTVSCFPETFDHKHLILSMIQ